MANAKAKTDTSMFYKLIYKALTVRADRVLLAFAAISLGCAVITALLSLYLDIKVKMSEELRAYGANFVISSQSDVPHSLDLNDLEQALALLPAEQVIGSTPMIYGIAHLETGDAVMAGVSFQGLKKVSPYWQVKGRWVSVDFDDRNTMIGSNLAKTMELGIGDKVVLSSDESDEHISLKIRGIVETGGEEDNQIFVNLQIADRLLSSSGKVDFGLVSMVVDGQEADQLADLLNAKIPSLHAKPLRNISQSDGAILEKIDGLMAVVAAFILVMTTLCVNATLASMISERSKEIGLQKALGAVNSIIIKQFLVEAAIISGLGASLGLILGFALAQILGFTIFGGTVAIHAIVIPIVLTVAMSIGVLAAIAPARRSALVSPALTLRGE